MRRLPHTVTRLEATQREDAYGDTVDGPLAAAGDPFPGYLQDREVLERDGTVVRRLDLHVRPSAPRLKADAVVEIGGARFRVDGDGRAPVAPSGRGRFVHYRLSRVTRGE